jgi:hypothetical protein
MNAESQSLTNTIAVLRAQAVDLLAENDRLKRALATIKTAIVEGEKKTLHPRIDTWSAFKPPFSEMKGKVVSDSARAAADPDKNANGCSVCTACTACR